MPAFLHAHEAAEGPARPRAGPSLAMCLVFQSQLGAWYAERAIDPTMSEEAGSRDALDRRHRGGRVHIHPDRGPLAAAAAFVR